MIKISTNKELLDVNFIHQFLKNSYWANERTLEQIKESIDNSLCFGMYLNTKQIGFARIITDKVVFSYLLDVFIDETVQGKKYGEKLLTEIYNHSHLKHVRSHYLHTKDAQNFYLKFGFKTYENPKRFMIKKG